MRLVGGKDYYDGVSGFDTDKRRTFVRKNFLTADYRPLDKAFYVSLGFNVSFKKLGENIFYSGGSSRLDKPYAPIQVIFCGKVYNGIVRTETRFSDFDTGIKQPVFHGFWNPQTLLADLAANEAELNIAKHWDGSRVLTADTLDEYFAPRDVKPDILEVLIAENIVHSIQYGTASANWKSWDKWFDNTDGLKTIGFAAAVDPWQAYQQIDMWLGSVLAKDEDNMVKLSDKELIDKHGFNKASFRNTHHVGKPRGQK